MDNDDMYICLD